MSKKSASKLLPITNKIRKQRHLRAISTGMMLTLPFIIIGALFLLIANPPINADLVSPNTSNPLFRFLLDWKDFSTKYHSLLTTPYSMTLGLLGVISSFTISYSLARDYKMKTSMCTITSVILFLMLSSKVVDGNISSKLLGSEGLFLSIITSIVCVEITRLIEKIEPKVNIKGNEVLKAFITSTLPLILNIVVLYGINTIVEISFNISLGEGLLKVLTPNFSIDNSLIAFVLVLTFGNILWLLGFNGTSIVFTILFTIATSNTSLNKEMISNGTIANHYINLQLFKACILGGAGNTIGLCILMLKSRSNYIRSLGRLSLIPVVCGINEPLIYGGPISFNPILGIPFVITPIVTCVLTYAAQAVGLLGVSHVTDPSFAPFFVQLYFSTLDIRSIIFSILLVCISIFIYSPFFNAYEENMLKEEII